MNCWICHSPSGARLFSIHVDGEPLRLQPVFCSPHGDAYLLRVGRVIGELLRDHSDPSQSGHTISREEERQALILADLLDAPGPVQPLPDKSGRSLAGLIPCCGIWECPRQPTPGHAYCDEHGELLDGMEWTPHGWQPIPVKSGRSGWPIGDRLHTGKDQRGVDVDVVSSEPSPEKSGYACHWFTRRDRDYYCDQGEGHSGAHHNANVPDATTWVDRPPDGVWLDSDGIPGPPVAKKP